MARRLRYLILAALIVCLGAGTAFFVVRSHLLARPEMLLEEAAKHIDLSLKDIDYTQITEGRKEWTLKATQVDYKQDADQFELKDVEVRLYRQGGGMVQLKGKAGIYNRKENWVQIRGRVLVKTDNGYILRGKAFTFDLKQRVLTSQDVVYISGPGFQIAGHGLKFEVASRKLILMSDVTTEILNVGDGKGA